MPHIYSWESSAYYHGYGLALLGVDQWREYFFKKYGFFLTAGVTLALIVFITTKHAGPNPQVAFNPSGSDSASQTNTFSAPSAFDQGAGMAKMSTPNDSISQAVNGISSGVASESADQSDGSSDAKIASSDQSDISSLSAEQ